MKMLKHSPNEDKGEDKRALKDQVLQAIYEAEGAHAPPDICNRLDQLLLCLTEVTKDNVCSNTKCPHYNKKCKMR